jgi:hypothetical protein
VLITIAFQHSSAVDDEPGREGERATEVRARGECQKGPCPVDAEFQFTSKRVLDRLVALALESHCLFGN